MTDETVRIGQLWRYERYDRTVLILVVAAGSGDRIRIYYIDGRNRGQCFVFSRSIIAQCDRLISDV